MWYHSWRDVRWRLALMALVNTVVTALLLDDAVSREVWVRRLSGTLPMLFAMNAIVLAGAGVATQISQRPAQVVHSSMLFILSLPITRRRLVLVRLSAGALAAIALMLASMSAFWFGAESLRTGVSAGQAGLYVACVAAFVLFAHAVSAAWSTVLDQLWQTYASLGVVGLIVGTMPSSRFWGAVFRDANSEAALSSSAAIISGMAASLLLAMVLAWITVRVVEAKQF